MSDKNMDDAFEEWWEGDPDDEPIDFVSKKQAKQIFTAGYLWGSRRPVFQMSAAQLAVLTKMIREQIERENNENLSNRK
jgi:hypothetical protein